MQLSKELVPDKRQALKRVTVIQYFLHTNYNWQINFILDKCLDISFCDWGPNETFIRTNYEQWYYTSPICIMYRSLLSLNQYIPKLVRFMISATEIFGKTIHHICYQRSLFTRNVSNDRFVHNMNINNFIFSSSWHIFPPSRYKVQFTKISQVHNWKRLLYKSKLACLTIQLKYRLSSNILGGFVQSITVFVLWC